MKPRTLTRFVIPMLLCAMLPTGCKPDEHTAEQLSTAAPSMEARAIADIANDVSRGVGKVISATNGGPHRVIVVEETHSSRVGQVEIAVMFLRLRDKYGLRRVSLEGAMSTDGPLSAKWFHDLNGGDAAQDAALRLLREGEISAGEFIALVRPEVEVVGNEKAEEYAVELADTDSTAGSLYLLAIAQQSMSQDQIRDANELITQHKQGDALKLIMESSEWTKERYRKLSDKYGTSSCEDMVVLLHEINAKANETGAKIDDKMRSGMAAEIAFFETACKRSNTMVGNTTNMFDAPGINLLALDIGAAHTAGVCRLLKESGASFAVIRPSSLDAHDEHGELASKAYERKVKGNSVDAAGLGAYLNGRGQRKPPPVIGKEWLQSKAEIYYATSLVSAAAAGGEQPPFQTIAPQLALLKAIAIDPASYELIEVGSRKRVIFKITARIDENDSSKTVEVWAGAWKEPPGPPDGSTRKTLEAFLLETREELMKQETVEEQDEGSGKAEETLLLPISKNVKAAFAKTQEAVRRVATSG